MGGQPWTLAGGASVAQAAALDWGSTGVRSGHQVTVSYSRGTDWPTKLLQLPSHLARQQSGVQSPADLADWGKFTPGSASTYALLRSK